MGFRQGKEQNQVLQITHSSHICNFLGGRATRRRMARSIIHCHNHGIIDITKFIMAKKDSLSFII
jgi:hypothetical protein